MQTAALVGTAVLAIAVAGCAADTGAGTGDSGTAAATVVATTTIWGSITEQIVACAGSGESRSLMPIGADPHDYEPSATDIAGMIGADLVIANGLGLEGGLASALDSASDDGAVVVELAPLLDPLPFSEDGHGHDADDGHGALDPHVWLDMGRAAMAAEVIGERLVEQTGDAGYAECAGDVSADISATEQELERILAAIPAADRLLVTDHDSLAYFAEAYGFEVAGVVIPGGSTLAEPSSAELAALTEVINASGVPAIFANTANPTALIDAVAAEAGDIAVVPLAIGSVGEPGTATGTYQEMMLSNATAIADALA